MILNFISIIFGFVFLYFGAEGLVRGSSSIAQSFKISSFVIGLTIVAIGTSIPELVVNIIASINNNPAIAIGNIVGSNIANILLILGVAALVSDLPIKDNTVLSEIPFSLIATLLLGFLANASLFDKRSFLIISRLDGGILLFFFALFILYIFKLSKKYGNAQDGIRVKIMSLPRSIIYIIFGITALLIGAKWVVDGAIKLSEFWVFSQGFLGLTMVALGTSLPELVTSLVAASRKNTDIAVGNIIGSNIFNILGIIGISAVINPLPFNVINNMDILMIIFASTLPILTMAIGKKDVIGRKAGVFFVLIYLSYIFLIWKRG